MRTDTRLVFCNKKLMRTDIFLTRTTKPICNFVNPGWKFFYCGQSIIHRQYCIQYWMVRVVIHWQYCIQYRMVRVVIHRQYCIQYWMVRVVIHRQYCIQYWIYCWQWASDCCSTLGDKVFQLHISMQEQKVAFWWDDDDVHFVQDQYA